MDNKYLPSLKKLQINNFSLFPGDLNFSYNFIQGVNLIIGGNGVGKTTMLNIIKYGLIGLYKDETDVKRREYKGIEYRYEKRIKLPYNYFSNRMTKDVDYNESAEVILTFNINEKTFEVTRNLFLPSIKNVKITEGNNVITLNGKIVSQKEYDELFDEREKNIDKLNATLQGQYETEFNYASGNESFNNIITLVNNILFFSEHRDTIMWDGEFQENFSSIYFIEPILLKELKEARLDSKYFDSLSRHKSEDIRAIRKVFDNIKDADFQNKKYKELVLEVEKLKKNVSISFKKLENIQSERNQIEVKISKFYSNNNQLHKKLDDLENQKRNEEQKLFSDIFDKVTPKYYDYLTYLKSSKDCPLCNNNLSISLYERIKKDDSLCMLCGNNIKTPQLSSDKLSEYKNGISDLLILIRNNEKEIISNKDLLEKLDVKYKNTNLLLNENQTELRKAEFAIQQFQSNDNFTKDSAMVAMKAQMDELEKQKDDASDKSKMANEKASIILNKIDNQRLDSTKLLSDVFNKYGNKFLGVPCELVYEDPKDGEGKRYLPRIDGIERYHEEELSESQRFFIDQSFRMSLLNIFSSSSSFFMCETPDSSLDISYEKNAAKVYLEYIKGQNALILTSNLNNSEFLDYLVEEAKGKINYINLLKIGKQSAIQTQSAELLKSSNKIENIINGKIK